MPEPSLPCIAPTPAAEPAAGRQRPTVFRRFFWRLYVGYAAVALLSAVIVGALLDSHLTSHAQNELGEGLERQARLLGHIAAPVLDAGAMTPALDGQLRKLAVQTATRFTLIRADGTVIGDSDVSLARLDNHGNRPEIMVARAVGIGTIVRRGWNTGIDYMFVAVPVRDGVRLLGYARAGMEMTKVAAEASEQRRMMALGTGLAVLVALGVGLVFARRLARPVTVMTRWARAVAAGDYQQPALLDADGDLGTLSAAFRAMVAQVRERIERQAQMDQSVRASEQRLRTILSSLQVGIVIIDPQDHRIVEMNKAACAMTGSDEASVVGQVCHRLICPAECGRCPITDGGQRLENADRVMLRADGTTLPVLKTALKIDLGHKPYILESFIDVSELKQAQQALAAAENKFRSLVEQSLVGIYVIQDGRLVYGNPRLAEMSGYPQEELLGAVAVKDLVFEDDRELVQERIRQRLAGEEMTSHYTFRLRRRDGQVLDVEVLGFASEYQGRAAIVGSMIDITERKQAEQALRQQVQRNQLVVQTSLDGFFSVDMDGRFLDVNPAYERMVGYSRQQLLTMRVMDVEARETPEQTEAHIAAVRHAGSARFEAQQRHSDGHLVDLEVAAAYTDVPVPQLFTFVRDITQAKSAEAELKRAKAVAESASATKSSFLANMSHEIRTPITAIVGYSDLMLEAGQSLSDRFDHLQVIRRNARHLLDLINDILDISKIEAGRMSVDLVPCDLTQIVGDAVSVSRARAVEKGLELEVVAPQPVPHRILTDPLRLKQILVNLMGNAVKFTEQGRVTLSIGYDDSDPEGRFGGGWLSFRVQDTGIGMSREQMARLFQPFSQADSSTTRRFGGTGLGLTISQRLAQMLGGRIEAESQPNAGSTFTLTIPVTVEDDQMVQDLAEAVRLPQAQLDAGAAATAALTQISGRILLAEDGIDNQRLISTHLRRAGAEVVVADNGRTAVDLARSQHFDLIVMDMQMPHLDGYGAASELRRRGLALPIIALTAHAMSDDREKCLKAGCSDYLSKPIDKQVLISTVKTYLDAARQQPPAPQETPPAPTPAAPAAAHSSLLRSALADDPDMRPIIDEFVQNLPEHVAQLASLLQQQQLDELRRKVHQLKGAGGGYGFAAITEAAAQAEGHIKGNDPLDTIAADVQSLIELIRSVEGYERTREITAGTVAPSAADGVA